MRIRTCALACLFLFPVWAQSTRAESTEMTIVTRVGLTDCCIEYQGLITSEAIDGVFDLYQEASPKPTTIVIQSNGGAAGAAMQLGTWMLDNELDVRVDTYCYSSCANYVFLAGRDKLLGPHASLMWHGGVTQPINRAQLEYLLDDMLGALDDDARAAVLAERSRERLLELLETSRSELIARETLFFERIGVDQRITVLGHLFERELLAQDHDYSGWDLSLEDLHRLGVRNIQVDDGAAWLPWTAREDLLVYRIRLDSLPDFSPRIP